MAILPTLLSATIVCIATANAIPYVAQSENNVNSYPPAPAPPYKNWQDSNPSGIQVQSGYEGYLVPEADSTELDAFSPHSFLGLSKWDILSSLVTPFISVALKLAFKLGFYTLGFGTLFALGAAITSSICAFTPLCTISFANYNVNSDSIKKYVNEDRVQRAAKFVYDSIEKYKKINLKKKKALPEKEDVKNVIKEE